MKKLILLSVVAGMFFVSCGSQAPATEEAATEVQVEETVVADSTAAPVADSAAAH